MKKKHIFLLLHIFFGHMVIYGMNEKATTRLFNRLSHSITHYKEFIGISGLQHLSNEDIDKLDDLAHKAHEIAPTFARKKLLQYHVLTLLTISMAVVNISKFADGETNSIAPSIVSTFFELATAFKAGYYKARSNNEYTKRLTDISSNNLRVFENAAYLATKRDLISQHHPKCPGQ